jgi:endonuclease/exonuclease/phosphatase family metal-dependent hydrolase
MKTHLTEYGFVGFGRDSSGQNCENSTATNDKGEGCFILYRKDAYTLKETKTYWLSPTPTVKSQYSIETDSYYRVVTFALLERKADGKQFVFCNNHLEVVGSAQLQTQIRTLEMNQVMGYMQPYMAQNVPVILVGDLNMTRTDGAFAPMVNAGLKSAEVTAEEVGKRLPTFPGNGLVIDHIMYSEDVHAEFYTVHTDTLNPSDHRPISAWMALK